MNCQFSEHDVTTYEGKLLRVLDAEAAAYSKHLSEHDMSFGPSLTFSRPGLELLRIWPTHGSIILSAEATCTLSGQLQSQCPRTGRPIARSFRETRGSLRSMSSPC